MVDKTEVLRIIFDSLYYMHFGKTRIGIKSPFTPLSPLSPSLPSCPSEPGDPIPPGPPVGPAGPGLPGAPGGPGKLHTSWDDWTVKLWSFLAVKTKDRDSRQVARKSGCTTQPWLQNMTPGSRSTLYIYMCVCVILLAKRLKYYKFLFTVYPSLYLEHPVCKD